MNLKGKTVLVTGGMRRIGREIAGAFAERGANVLIHYHASKEGADGPSYQADLSKVAEIRRMARKILKDFGGVDILVNNAALFFATPFGSTTEREWDRLFAVNLKAAFFLCQELAPAMKKRGNGRIINIADWSGFRPYTGYLPYCVSKAALIALTEGLAKTLAPKILVTAVCPGPILPPPGFGADERKKIARKTLVGRWGRPEDVARMTVFLAESDFVTGSFHLVDGGEFLRG